MRRSRHKNPPSTTGRYLPGVGYTITQANIRLAERGLLGNLGVLTTPLEVANHFPTRADYGKNPRPQKDRHLARAARLMGGV